MNDNERRRLEMFIRGRQFGTDNAPETLTELVKQLEKEKNIFQKSPSASA